MTMALPCLISLAVVAVSGWLLLAWLAPDAGLGRAGRAALGLGLGLGLATLLQFAIMALAGTSLLSVWWWDLGLLAALALAVALRRGAPPQPDRVSGPAPAAALPRWLRWVLALVALKAVLTLALAAFVNPHGAWDGWGIWNLHARFLFRGGAQWKALFADYTSHPDYPLLLPLAVVRTWLFAGGETDWGQVLTGLAFTTALALATYAAVASLRGRAQGLLALLTLLGTPMFLNRGGSQCADVPLALYLLASLWLLLLDQRRHRPGLIVLAGFSAGLAAWTKNEGLLFIAAFIPCLAAVGLAGRGARATLGRLAWLALGLALPLAVVAWFKLSYAPVNDLVAGQGWRQSWLCLSDASRWAEVLAGFWRYGLGFSEMVVWPWPVLAAYLLLMGVRTEPAERPAQVVLALVLALMLAGYLLVYVTSPVPLDYHLRSSYGRLMLQLWPSFLLLFFTLARPPGGAREAWHRGASGPAGL